MDFNSFGEEFVLFLSHNFSLFSKALTFLFVLLILIKDTFSIDI